MNINCEVIQDLLPLYAEKIASDSSAEIIEEHISTCENCRKLYESMTTVFHTEENSTAPLKKVKRNMNHKIFSRVLAATLFVLIVISSVYAFITTPEYFPYSENTVSTTQTAHSVGGGNDPITIYIMGEVVLDSDDYIKSIRVTFNEEITSVSVEKYVDENGNTVAEIMAWTSILDRWMNKKAQPYVITDKDDIDIVYYCAPGDENVLLYNNGGVSVPRGDGVVTLPRLALNYYLYTALAGVLIVGFLWLVFRKNPTASKILEKIFFLPVSYIIAHLIVKGISGTTYTIIRDFSLIILITALIYAAGLLVLSVIKKRRFKLQLEKDKADINDILV